MELLFRDEVYAIIGAAIDVHKDLGNGFLEAVYQEAMERELTTRGIPFEPQKSLRIRYKGDWLNKEYFADLVYFGSVIVELKVIKALTNREEAQLLHYLKATGFRVGILINFGDDGRLDWKRMVR